MAQWVQNVKTTTVATPKGVMTLPAEEMVQVLLDENPDLPLGSIIRYIQFYLNRGGKGIPEERRQVIEQAKAILQQRNRTGESHSW